MLIHIPEPVPFRLAPNLHLFTAGMSARGVPRGEIEGTKDCVEHKGPEALNRHKGAKAFLKPNRDSITASTATR